MDQAGGTRGLRAMAPLLIVLAAAVTCLLSVALLLAGLLRDGPAFYHGGECRMTYSHFQFLPLRVSPSSSARPTERSTESRGRYRLLKFTDQRDPRHKHLYPISDELMENYQTQNNPKRTERRGRLLELNDNWCLLPQNHTVGEGWREAPHPHRGHPVLYVPGHWGSFSQARSIGAHGTRWTGQRESGGLSDQQIYESLRSGTRMSGDALEEFVMDIFALDFGGEGAALHSSKLLRQAEFFARAIETIAQGCQLSHGAKNGGRQQSITIVAHSIGAWVVRIAMRMHPHLTQNGWVRNVVTLASPLGMVPYAVDAGVHDIARHINDAGGDEGDVAMISISGGLRDEMIPPEACQIPAASERNGKMASDAFLASSIVQRGTLSADAAFGMDHRAIVWCYDVLKVVREVIFSMEIASDKGQNSAERLSVAQSIMHRGKANDPSLYQEEVANQHVHLVQENDYWKAVSIQLSAPYHLNSLLKLCIAAGLLRILAILPILHHFRGRAREGRVEEPFVERCFPPALNLLAFPLLITAVTWVRQSELPSWGPACVGHECRLLLGTIFVLSQLATLIHFIITHFACALVASIRGKCSIPRNKTSDESDYLSKKSFWGIFVQCCMQQLRLLSMVILPLTATGCVIVHVYILGHEDTVWNRTSIAACCFISCALLVFLGLANLSCRPAPICSEERRCHLLILFLSLAKALYGKILYAFSLISEWGQSDLTSYDDFLAAVDSHAGVIGGHHNEMIICSLTTLLPAFLAMTVVQAYDVMVQNSTSYWKATSETSGNGEAAMPSDIKEVASKRLLLPYTEPKVSIVAHCCIVSWYTWSVSANFAGDNLLVPLYSILSCMITYSKCRLLSHAVMDICSAIASDDLSLRCDSPITHDKKE